MFFEEIQLKEPKTHRSAIAKRRNRRSETRVTGLRDYDWRVSTGAVA